MTTGANPRRSARYRCGVADAGAAQPPAAQEPPVARSTVGRDDELAAIQRFLGPAPGPVAFTNNGYWHQNCLAPGDVVSGTLTAIDASGVSASAEFTGTCNS